MRLEEYAQMPKKQQNKLALYFGVWLLGGLMMWFLGDSVLYLISYVLGVVFFPVVEKKEYIV